MNTPRKLTSREAYNRLFWDPRIQRDAFTIVYADRATASGTNETSLVRWDPQGSIPWHRIEQIRCGDEIVWSKEIEEHQLDYDQLPPAGRIPVTTAPVAENYGDRLRPRPVHRHLHTTWEPTEEAGVVPATGSLRVSTWNVLYDFADPDLVPVRVRLPHLLAELEQNHADIFALQEVTPELLREWLAVPRNYPVYLSESPAMSGIEPHGVCLLSRHPFTLTEYAAGKRPVLIGTWRFPDRLLHVANLHLPSNRAADATQQRSQLLEGLFTELEPFTGDVLVTGDFNLVGSELDDLFETFGYEDVWSRLNPGVEGITYDPPVNPLARANSRNGLPVRFDRVHWRSSATPFTPTEIKRFAMQPDPELPGGFPSDHYGLCSRWTWGTDDSPLTRVQPCHQSALAIIPPAELWPPIQSIRQQFDKQIHRWMPHINLLYGFLPQAHFAAAAQRIAEALRELSPFDITLKDFDTFTHTRSVTAWLRPVGSPAGQLQQLQARLQELFPTCAEQSKRESGFTPHLSVGQFNTVQQARQNLPAWSAINWQVTQLALIARSGDEPFQIHWQIPLGGGSPRCLATAADDDTALNQWLERLHPEAGEQRQVRCDEIRRQLSEIVADLTGWGNSVEWAGSWRIGVAHPDSDLDLIAVIPDHLDRLKIIHQVQEQLRGQAEEIQFAAAARVPKLTFRLHGQSVDLLTASVSRPPQQSLTDYTADDFSDPEGWQIVRACRESDGILEAVRQFITLPTFRQLLRAVRTWAEARQLQGNAWGFLGGFPWAVLTAWSVQQRAELAVSDPDTPVSEWLANFFQSLCQHPWPQPISLTMEGAEYQPAGPRDRLPIIRPTLPLENSAYNITRSTASILRAEWTRAARLFASGNPVPETLQELFAPVDLRRETPLILVVNLNGPQALLRECAGQLEGHYVGLLIHLERELHLAVRPWPGIQQHGDSSRFLIGLPLLRPVDRTGIRQAVDELLTQLPGSSQLRWRSEIVGPEEVE